MKLEEKLRARGCKRVKFHDAEWVACIVSPVFTNKSFAILHFPFIFRPFHSQNEISLHYVA